MAGYLGYFFQGMQSGIQTGTQLLEMKWKKDQKKKLEQKEAELMEASSIFNKAVSMAGEDGFYSEDEIMKIDAMYIALSYEVKDRVEGSYKAMQAMDKKVVEENNQWFDYLREGIEGLDAKDVQALFDFVRPNIKGEKGLLTLEGLEDLTKKRQGIVKEEEAWERVGKLPPGYQVPYLEQQGIDIPEAEPEAPKPPTFSEKRFNWKIEQYNQKRITLNQLLESEGISMSPEKATGLEKQIQDIKTEGERAGIDPDKINKAIQDKILGKGVTTAPTAFKTLQTIKDSFKNVKTRAEYNEALASYNASKEAKVSDWTPPAFEEQLTDLIKRVESALWSDYVDKDGKLKSKIEAEEYNAKLQHYLRLIEEARNAGIDVNMFQAFIPYKATKWGLGNPLVTSESW